MLSLCELPLTNTHNGLVYLHGERERKRERERERKKERERERETERQSE